METLLLSPSGVISSNRADLWTGKDRIEHIDKKLRVGFLK